jgi:hypothetical protein
MPLKDDLLQRKNEKAAAATTGNEPKPVAPNQPAAAKPVAGAEDAMTCTLRPGEAAFIEFHISPGNCLGYAAHQLMQFQLITHKPDLADDPTKPTQTLTLGLQTVDLVITGDRLHLITAALRKNELAALRACPGGRYAELNLKQPYIDKIEPKELKPDEAQG